MGNDVERRSLNSTGDQKTSANVLSFLGIAIVVAIVVAVFFLVPWSNVFKEREDTAYSRGTASMVRKEWSKAVQFFEKSLKANPDNTNAYIGLSRAYTQLGELDKALQSADKALQLDSTNAISYGQRGLIKRMQGKSDEALQDFSNAIKRDPDSAWTHAQIADLYLRKHDLEKAIAYSNQAHKLKPDFVEGLRLHATILTRTGKCKEALEVLNKAVKLSPKDPWVLQDKAWFLLTCPDERFRDVGKGMDLAKKAYDLSKGQGAIIQETLAEAYFRQGNALAAVVLQKKAIALRIKDCPDGSCVTEMEGRLRKYQMAARQEVRSLYDILPAFPSKDK